MSPRISEAPACSGRSLQAAAAAPRIEAAIHRIRGAVQEPLLASGFLDSIGAMELVAAIQQDLGVTLAELQLTDLATVTTLVVAVAATVRGQGVPPARGVARSVARSVGQ
jgi:aryl carrier-like protein